MSSWVTVVSPVHSTRPSTRDVLDKVWVFVGLEAADWEAQEKPQ